MNNLQLIESLLGENINEINIVKMIRDVDDMVIIETRRKYNRVLYQMQNYKYIYNTETSSREYYQPGRNWCQSVVQYKFDHINNVLLVKKTKITFDEDFNIFNLTKKTYLYYDPIDHIFLTGLTPSF